MTMLIDELFKAEADFESAKLKRCRTCVHRVRFELNEYSSKIVQCCELRPSRKSNSGFVTIKVTDVACNRYEER